MEKNFRINGEANIKFLFFNIAAIHGNANRILIKAHTYVYIYHGITLVKEI